MGQSRQCCDHWRYGPHFLRNGYGGWNQESLAFENDRGQPSASRSGEAVRGFYGFLDERLHGFDRAQQVEQAIKTLTQKSLKGSEIVDLYIDKDGTMYALAQVDLKRVETVIKEAEELGAVKNHTDDGSLEKMFDEMGKKAAPPAPPAVASGEAVSGGAVGGATSRPSDEEQTRERRGGKPGWVDGYGSEYPHEIYLCGVDGPGASIGRERRLRGFEPYFHCPG